MHHHHSKYCCANGKLTVCNSYSSGLHMWGRVGQGWCSLLAYFINYSNCKFLIISVDIYFFIIWRQIKQANDTEEANNFHAATQKSVRTSGFRIRGDFLKMRSAMQNQPINIYECVKDSGALRRLLVIDQWWGDIMLWNPQASPQQLRLLEITDDHRDFPQSSGWPQINCLEERDYAVFLRSGSGSVRSGTERATASISRPALRAFRPDSTSSASFSVSSSVSTSTSSQRTPRRSLFGTTDRRRFFARRRLWKSSVVVYHASFNSQYKLFLLVDDHHCWRWWWWLSWWQEVILDIQLLSSV